MWNVSVIYLNMNFKNPDSSGSVYLSQSNVYPHILANPQIQPNPDEKIYAIEYKTQDFCL